MGDKAIRDGQYTFGRGDIVGHLVTVKTHGISRWGADCTCGWSVRGRDEDVETAALRHLDELDVVPVHDGFESMRARIGALEAVIEEAFAVEGKNHAAVVGRMRALLSLAPSVILDEMIREAKAEAVEAARDAIMPPVNWNLRPDGTEMPGTQHIDEALRDIHVQLSEVAAEYRGARP